MTVSEEGLILCLLRRPGESNDEALARFYEAEQVDPELFKRPMYKAHYLFIRDNAFDDIAITPEILADHFDFDPEVIYSQLPKVPADTLPLYIKGITQDYVKRVALDVSQQLKSAAESGDPQVLLEAVRSLDELDTSHEKRVYSLAEQAAVFLTAFDEDQARFTNHEIRPAFPLARLNEMVPRIMDDDIILVTAKSKTGKSSFSTQFAYTNARTGLNVAYFHFEDPPARVGYRRAAQTQVFLSQSTRERFGNPWGLPYGKMMAKELTDQEKAYVRFLTQMAIREAGTNLTYVYASGWTCEKMVSVWRQLHKQRPFDLVIVDYLNKMALSSTKLRNYGQWGSRGQDVELIKQEAGRPNARVPVVLVQQENEDGTARDSKDSYIKAQVWISLQRNPVESDPDRFEDDGEVVVKRANDGTTGAIPAMFYPPYMIWSQK
jgi:hypothetical protein